MGSPKGGMQPGVNPVWASQALPTDGPDLAGAASREETILRWLDWHAAPLVPPRTAAGQALGEGVELLHQLWQGLQLPPWQLHRGPLESASPSARGE